MFHATTVLAVRHLDTAVMASDGQVTFGDTVVHQSARELAKDWPTDRFLRRLEAMLIVMDARQTYLLSGNGDLIEPDDGIIAIGSGGAYAMAAAKALAGHTQLDAREISPHA